MRSLLLLLSISIFLGCIQSGNVTVEKNDVEFPFTNGVSMEETSVDPMGNIFSYPKGEAGITGQTARWEKGFESGWHYHPYTGVAYVIQGELTVKFDENTPLEDLDGEKTVTKEQVFGPGSAFLGVPLVLIVLFLGLNGKASIINGPVVAFEVTQQGSNGLYLLYLMAVYLAVFAVTMLLQFTSYFMGSSHKILNGKEN